MTTPRFQYRHTPVKDVQVASETDAKTGKLRVKSVSLDGEVLKPSSRFWDSLYSRFGFSQSVFKYFSHAEVFNRISEKSGDDRIRLCIERPEGKDEGGTLLAVSNPKKPLVQYDQLAETLSKYGAENFDYAGGLVNSSHKPRVGGGIWSVAGDAIENRFMMETPIDGYGMPNIYLSLLRQVCTNGMVAYAKAFRSSLGLGRGADDVTFAISRALDGFNHDEGYATLRQRFESAVTSWASVFEANELYRLLLKLHNTGGIQFDGNADSPIIRKHLRGHSTTGLLAAAGDPDEIDESAGSPILTAFHKATGDMQAMYGIANIDSLSTKRQKTLPVKAKVYELFNFATEVATHHATTQGARKAQAWVGSLLSDEYDMEGTATSVGDFDAFLIDSKVKAGVTGNEVTKN